MSHPAPGAWHGERRPALPQDEAVRVIRDHPQRRQIAALLRRIDRRRQPVISFLLLRLLREPVRMRYSRTSFRHSRLFSPLPLSDKQGKPCLGEVMIQTERPGQPPTLHHFKTEAVNPIPFLV